MKVDFSVKVLSSYHPLCVANAPVPRQDVPNLFLWIVNGLQKAPQAG